MTQIEIEHLTGFITRPEMYCGIDNKSELIAFVNGFQIGARNYSFTEKLSSIIETKHNIIKRATGWPGQVENFSHANNLVWTTAFKNLSLEVLDLVCTESQRPKFELLVKSIVKQKVKQIKIVQFDNGQTINRFNQAWINKWYGLTSFEKDWFEKIWENKEFVILKSINSEIIEISKCGKFNNLKASSKLIELSEEFLLIE